MQKKKNVITKKLSREPERWLSDQCEVLVQTRVHTAAAEVLGPEGAPSTHVKCFTMPVTPAPRTPDSPGLQGHPHTHSYF